MSDVVENMKDYGQMWSVILNDDRTWRDRNHQKIPLERMEARHRANVRRFIRRRVRTIRMAVELWEITDMPESVTDMLSDEELGWEDSDLAWLQDKPLYQRLVELDLDEATQAEAARVKENLDNL